MSILDKLVEKKDLEAYLGLRAAFLRNEITDEIQKQPDSKKESIHERFKGRILELDLLKQVVKSGNMKRDSKRYYKATKIINNSDEHKIRICPGCSKQAAYDIGNENWFCSNPKCNINWLND